MLLQTPAEVRRNFAKGSNIAKRQSSDWRPRKPARMQRSNYWTGKKLDYEFLEKCKELICRIPHTSTYKQWGKSEIRLSVLRWSRGCYVDIRQYSMGKPTGIGILLHLDLVSVLLPELVALVRQLELDDAREPEQKTHTSLIPLDAPLPGRSDGFRST